MDFTFPKEKRLLNAKHYDVVFSKGRRGAGGRYMTILVHPNSLAHSRLGLVIGKKAVGNAVCRNRVKRLIRTVFRLHQHEKTGLDIVVIAKQGIGTLSKSELRQELEKQWEKL